MLSCLGTEESSVALERGRILVAGANGHLGQRLLRHLAKQGRPARALVRSERAATAVRDLGCEVAIADYGDPTALAKATQGCDGLAHLAGILKESRTTSYEQAHERASQGLARAASDTSVGRIAYVSILGASAASPNRCLASKGRAEEILLSSPVPAVVLQVPMVLGAGDFAAQALQAKARSSRVFLVRGGATLEQPLDADDLVAAILAALDEPELGDERLLLAGPESLPHRDLVARAAAVLGRPAPRVVSIPYAAARAAAALAERLLSDPPVTLPMLEVLEHDDRIDPTPAAARLGISLTPLNVTLRRVLLEAA
jgi:NADH dehydrogenase